MEKRQTKLPLLSAALCLLPLAALADPAPATIVVGGRVVPFQVKPFVGADGQVMAPVDAVVLLGAKFAPNADGTVGVTSANGRQFSFPYQIVQGRYCVPFQKVAQSLGASVFWQPVLTTLTVRAKLEMVRQSPDELTVYTSYPVYYSVKRIDNPERLYVDLVGLDLASAPANVPSTSGTVTHVRSGQMDYETVRITVDLKQGQPFRVLSGIQSSQVQVALGASAAPPVTAAPLAPIASRPAAPVAVVTPPSRPGPVTITSVAYKVISPALTQVSVTTSAPTPLTTERLDDPSRLAFDLAGASLDRGLKLSQTVDNSVLKAIRIGPYKTARTAFGRVVLDLSHMVGFSVDTRPLNGGMTYLINVITSGSGPALASPIPSPPIVGSLPPTDPMNVSLAGKLIVIDPGHGGKDTGARDEFRTGQVYEKDITLAIARRVRDVLQKSGATVLMTRDEDVLPPVMARPQFANDHHADYFVSIHCDSSGGQNSHAGTTVYFHAQNGLCRLMASDIGRRVSETSGIPYDGIKSDTIRFATGFGVLRGSEMPAVLVETGYMNNDSDLAKLRDDATQQNIAQGIVAGLRDFTADRVSLLRSAGNGQPSARRAY